MVSNIRNGIFIRPEKYVHYLIIYLMLSLNGSFWFFLNQDIILRCVVAFYFIAALIFKKYKPLFPFLVLALLLYTVFIIRLNVGGLGIGHWFLWSGQILIMFAAYLFNKEKFAERYVKIIFALSVISLICWAISFLHPSLLTSFLTVSDAIPYNGTFYGKLFYVYRTSLIDISISARNNGIFTEPGIYQVVLTSCMYMLLFHREKLNLSKKKYFIFCIVISAASTTGLIAMAILFIYYFLKSNKKSEEDKKFRRIVMIIAFLLAIAVLTDINVNGDNSLFNNIIANKLEAASTETGSSGGVRLATMNVYLDEMIKNPFGTGYDKLSLALAPYIEEWKIKGAGVGLIGFFTAIGVIPTIMIILIMVYPYYMGSRLYLLDCLAFLCLYANTGLAQTYAFYPSLLIIPLLYYYDRKQNMETKNNTIKGRYIGEGTLSNKQSFIVKSH
jgi:hypothetical protein